MDGNLIVWSLNQLTIGIWKDRRLLFGNTEVQNQWKYTLSAEFSSFRRLYFRSISMAVMATDTTAMNRLGNTNDKIRNLS